MYGFEFQNDLQNTLRDLSSRFSGQLPDAQIQKMAIAIAEENEKQRQSQQMGQSLSDVLKTVQPINATRNITPQYTSEPITQLQMGTETEPFSSKSLYTNVPQNYPNRKVLQTLTGQGIPYQEPTPPQAGSPEANTQMYADVLGKTGEPQIARDIVNLRTKVPKEEELPYKKGSRQTFINSEGKSVEGTFKGLDTSGNPIFESITTKASEVKGLPAETGGKLAMVKQAYNDIDEAESLLFGTGKVTKEGNFEKVQGKPKLSKEAQFGGWANVPIGYGREISSRIQNAVAAKLRVETGAQANPGEVKNISGRFVPNPFFDDETSTKDKIRRLRTFMSETTSIIDPEGKYQDIMKKELPQLGQKTTIGKPILKRNKRTGEIWEFDEANNPLRKIQ